MAFDGIAVANIVFELKNSLIGGRVDKIYQPHKDEIIMSVRNNGTSKLLLSANPSHPRLHITKIQKENPMTAPMFCMVLRKHIAGSRITNISQEGLERIVYIDVEAMNEMGDMVLRRLIIEIMGKHSNIILSDENGKILDSIKHISHETSSVREVLPGKEYVLPPSQNKLNPLTADYDTFRDMAKSRSGIKVQQFIYKTYTGISPSAASEIAFRAEIDPESYMGELNDSDIYRLFSSFSCIIEIIKHGNFSPEIISDPKTNKVIDFYSFESTQFNGFKKTHFEIFSELLEKFYYEKDNAYNIQQKAHDMRHIVALNIERCVKKKDIQAKTENDTKGMEMWKLKGELITANIFAIKKGMKNFRAVNYYDENAPEIEIALDENLTPSENAQKYYNKYNKAKRTLAAIEIQKKQNDDELKYLESVLANIDNSTDEADINDIKKELVEEGFIKSRGVSKNKSQKQKKSKAAHFISSDGYDIFVGKSNIQNDELTLRTAKGNDIWLHTKNIPGSHVIIITNGTGEAPDSTLIEAAMLAAFNSKAKTGSQVPVDYVLKKFVKKPAGAKPGMVIYEKNNTIYVTPDEEKIKAISKADL